MTETVTCVWPLKAELGEGPVWRAAERALWFVDIKARRIHRFEPDSGKVQSWTAPSAPGFLAPTASGWIVGLKTGLHAFDPATGAFSYLATVEDPALDNRLNDGFAAPDGRLWFGSMHDPEAAPTGALYRYDDRGLAQLDTGYCITNGPCQSPDGRIFYHTDTLARVVYAFDIGPQGALTGKRPLIRIEDGAGHPDGTTVDSEGCLWVALFGGWGVRRYSPEGRQIGFVRFPCANVTKIAFGGDDLRTAYATTAWLGLTAVERAAQPLAGGLFRFTVPAPGLPQGVVLQG
jgi:sugar lactone lactonase YvrE